MAAPVSDSDEPITGINVIPLVDVILVLLIIFMMTASFIVSPAVNIDLPKVSKGEDPPTKNLHFVVDQSGAIYLNEKKVNRDAVSERVRQAVSENPKLQALVSADRQVPYGEVVTLLDTIRSAGLNKFAISVETVATTSQ